MAREDAIEVLGDERGMAAVLEHNGHDHDAKLIRRICDRFAEAAHEYLNFMSEPEAQLRTGKSERQLRRLFVELEARGHAKRINGKRYFREVMLEPRANLSAAREAGRRAAAGGSR
jgi:AraC-like DNA-binding protein